MNQMNLSKKMLAASLTLIGIMSLVPEAEARVGRPLTPVSVAGVARRTVRRCAVGVYYCQLKKAVPASALKTRG